MASPEDDVWSSSRGEPNPGNAAGRRRTQTEVSLPAAAKGEREGKATDNPGVCPLEGCTLGYNDFNNLVMQTL